MANAAASDTDDRRIHAARERARLQRMDEETKSDARARRTVQERARLHAMDEETKSDSRARRTVQERARVQQLDGEALDRFRERNAVNQRNYQHNQGALITDEAYALYLEDFAEDVKLPLEEHPFVILQQEQFQDAISRYRMRHCIVCRERWPTTINLHIPEAEYVCQQCSRDREEPKRYSSENDMHPVTLISGEVDELRAYYDANPLECMLVALACPVMRVVRHKSGNLIYQSHSINFLQDFVSFFGTNRIPRRASATPYFVVVKRGSNGEVIEARVRRHYVFALCVYLLQHNPLYQGLILDEEALNALPEDGVWNDVIIYTDENADDSEAATGAAAANDSVGTMDSTVPMPQAQQLEADDIRDRLLQFSRDDLSTQESDSIESRLSEMLESQQSRYEWPQLGSQPLNEFTTQRLMAMCFPENFLNGRGDPTNTVRLRDVTLANAGKHLMKYCVRNHLGDYVYPFAQHERIPGWFHSFIERRRTLTQANYCMQQHQELRYTTVEELAGLLRNGAVGGSDPFWFQRRRELTAQVEQEGLQGTLFWTFSAADNHWKPLMKLLGVAEDAPINVRRAAVRNNPHIVDFYFCRRVEKAVTHLFRKSLLADWMWYRYEFQMRGATHAHGMAKLKVAPDILDGVARVYGGRKAAEMIQCRTVFNAMSDVDKEAFRQASTTDKIVAKEYAKCVAAAALNLDELNRMRISISEGIEAEAAVIKFHKWLVTTMNDDFPPSDDISGDENELIRLNEHYKRLIVEIAINQAKNQDHSQLVTQKDSLEQQMLVIRNLLEARRNEYEAAFGNRPVADPHPCTADWNDVRNSLQHYKQLTYVQRHKCVGTYCLRRKKRADGTEYGEQYCRFGFPLSLRSSWCIEFSDLEGGGVKANFFSKRNDPRMSQHCRMHLMSWMANCDMQIVLDEEQAIRYLVKYASKPEKKSHHITDLLRSLIPANGTGEETKESEEETKQSEAEETKESEEETKADNPPVQSSVSGPTLIRRVAIKSVGERNKSQQEVMHLLLQEPLYHSDFVYVNIHLDKHDVRLLIPQDHQSEEKSEEPARAFYPNIFDLYGQRESDHDLSFLQFCRKYEVKKGELKLRNKRTAVLTYPNRCNNAASKYYWQYCKYFLMKHKVWSGHVRNAWDGPIVDPENGSELTDENNEIVQQWYISRFHEFREANDISSLEIVNADADRLRRIRNECEMLYMEEEEALGMQIGEQDGWMQVAGVAPTLNDANIPDELAPPHNSNVNWVEQRVTPEELVSESSSHLYQQKAASQHDSAQRHTEGIDLSMLNAHQKMAVDVVRDRLNDEENQLLMCIFGGPGTGKSTVIKGINQAVVSHFQNENSIIRLGTTGTAAFEISGTTCHSCLFLPVNRPFANLTGTRLTVLQNRFRNVRVIIIDEVSMMGKKMLYYIDQRLRQISGKKDEPFGGFWIIFVGDFQQLPPVGDKALYEEDHSAGFMLFESVSDVIELVNTQRQSGNDPVQQSFKRVLANCQNGTLDQHDWEVLQRRFVQNAVDSASTTWDNVPHLFYDNKSSFEYNMTMLRSLGTPIARVKAEHNCAAASKRDSTEANGLHSELYLARNAEVMLTSNLWSEVGLHNGAKGKVLDLLYETADGPGPSGTVLPAAIVVQFHALDSDFVPFIPSIPGSVAIPVTQAEWTHNGKHFMRKQFPLMLAWAYTIHKSQGKTLDKVWLSIWGNVKSVVE